MRAAERTHQKCYRPLAAAAGRSGRGVGVAVGVAVDGSTVMGKVVNCKVVDSVETIYQGSHTPIYQYGNAVSIPAEKLVVETPSTEDAYYIARHHDHCYRVTDIWS